ncbi:MAG: polymer-forming cytoskeletal protein [Spirochaetaceae bacterium]
MPDPRLRTIDEEDIETIVAEDVHFDGELAFDKSLIVKGRLEGTISSSGDLFVNEGASVDATIKAALISVRGAVQGQLIARERIELFSSAVVKGTLEAPDLIVQSGCSLNGECRMPAAGGKR